MSASRLAAMIALACVSGGCFSAPITPTPTRPGDAPRTQAPKVPQLPAPWNEIDFGGTADEAFARLGGSEGDPDCDGLYVTAGTCWTPNDSRGTLTITLYFESVDAARAQLANAWGPPIERDAGRGLDDWTESWIVMAGSERLFATLEPRGGAGAWIGLDRIVPLATFVRGPAPDGIGAVLGLDHAAVASAYGARTACSGTPISCQLWLPPTEAGYADVFVDFENGVAHRVHWVTQAPGTFVDSRARKVYATVFGPVSTAEHDEDRFLRFARAPQLRMWVRRALPSHGLACLGACDDYEPPKRH